MSGIMCMFQALKTSIWTPFYNSYLNTILLHDGIKTISGVGGKFVSIGQTKIAVTTDFATWIDSTGSISLTSWSGVLTSVSPGGLFIVFESSYNKAWTSSDLSSWGSSNQFNTASGGNVLSSNLIHNGSKFLCVCSSMSPRATLTSANGLTWTANTGINSLPFNGYSSLLASDELGVVINIGADSSLSPYLFKCYRSLDYGVTWSDASSNFQTAISPAIAHYGVSGSVVFGSGKFVAIIIGDDGVQRIVTSPDGSTWTARTLPQIASVTVPKITWDGVKFVVIYYEGASITSIDGITWVLSGSCGLSVVPASIGYAGHTYAGRDPGAWSTSPVMSVY